jgi:phenylacetate-CoA ligase
MSLRDTVLSASERFSTPLSYVPNFLRVGFGYLGELKAITAAEKSEPHVLEHQLFGNLQRLLRHAVEKVEFYRDFYRSKGFAPDDFKKLEDWNAVPIVTKRDFQQFTLEARCASGVTGILSNTGGTSGEPLAFRLARNATQMEWAHMHTLWEARGYRSSHLKLRFGGVYFNSSSPIIYHPRHNEYIVNANSPMSQVVQAVLAISASRLFRWVHGYPSLVAEFARALELNVEGSNIFRQRLFGVLLGSEFPAAVYREPIAKILSSNIVSWYGHSEMAVLAGESAEGIYQSLPTYGYAEAVGIEGGQEHRLICTSLHNFTHPFIRYDTGDLIRPVSNIGGSLAFRVTDGRIGDFVVDRKGCRLPLTSIIFGRHHAAFDDLLHLQVRQDVPGTITLLIVPRSMAVDLVEMKKGIDFKGLDIDWQIKLVSSPIRTKNGKIKLKVDA